MTSDFFQPFLQFLAWTLNRRLAEQLLYLKEENAILRARLPKRITVTPQKRMRLSCFGAPLGRAIVDLITIVTPRTFARWLQQERKTVRKRLAKGLGRRLTPEDIEALVVKMARENSWGYTRILGELRKLGIRKICRTTVRNILREHHLEPGPKRGQGSWDEFLKRHFATLWSCDFFSVKTWTMAGLIDVYVLFFVHVGTRKVYVAGITAHPDSEAMAQLARNLSLFFDEQQFLLRDRDTKFTKQFDAILESEGVEVVPVALRAPNRNAAAERQVQSVKTECLNHFTFFEQKHLSYVLRQWQKHCNSERPHQGVGNRALGEWQVPQEPQVIRLEEVVCEERLGGGAAQELPTGRLNRVVADADSSGRPRWLCAAGWRGRLCGGDETGLPQQTQETGRSRHDLGSSSVAPHPLFHRRFPPDNI
jgi:putative transposase